jgi:hypothetical protein
MTNAPVDVDTLFENVCARAQTFPRFCALTPIDEPGNAGSEISAGRVEYPISAPS